MPTWSGHMYTKYFWPTNFEWHINELATFVRVVWVAADVVSRALFPVEKPPSLVAVRDIPVSSLCEHHLMPFSGSCHIV